MAEQAPSGRVTRATLTEQLETAIRSDIVDGRLRPGQKVRASALSERYGVSATPLREALQRLAGSGWVSIDARLGGTVAKTTAAELRDIYWLRGQLESLAIERSLATGDGDWEAAVSSAWSRLLEVGAARSLNAGNDEPWLAAHRDFHRAIVRASGS